MQPPDCYMIAPPNVVDYECWDGATELPKIELPEGAVVPTSQHGDGVSFTVAQKWTEDVTGMAMMYDQTIGDTTCVVKGDIQFGDSEDFDGECTGGVVGITVVVYMDVNFNPEECEACETKELCLLYTSPSPRDED